MARPQTVLIIDDEPQIHRFLGVALEAAGYLPLSAETGAVGLQMINRHNPDAVLLDLGLPDTDGEMILKEGRSLVVGPILIISARTQETEKIEALDLGADDYVEKPFGVGELLARLRVGLRTWSSRPVRSQPLPRRPVEIDVDKRQVRVRGAAVRLSRNEYQLIAHLISRPGRAASYQELVDAVWNGDEERGLANLRILVAMVRRKIEVEPGAPEVLVTEQGFGYRLKTSA